MKIQIAILEDHTMLVEHFEQYFNALHHIELVFTARNIAQLEKNMAKYATAIDILIADIHLPDGDGIHIAHYYKSKYPHLKVIILTGNGDAVYLSKTQQHGIDGYMEKHEGTMALSDMIERVYKNEYCIHSYQHLNRNSIERYYIQLFDELKDYEKEFLQLAASNKTYLEISQIMYKSRATIESYARQLIKKFGVLNRQELILLAVQHHAIRL
jgi:DNA-binding NarL/FixJ family response regulator